MYGLTKADVLIFGVAANVVAAIGAVAAGVFDDRLGPKRVILVSLVGLIASGIVLVFLSGQRAFWIFGLALCQFVGPAQSASRSFLIRVAPVGHEGQMFGLYTTTGRVVSFLAPMLFSLFAKLWGSEVRHHRHRAHPRSGWPPYCPFAVRWTGPSCRCRCARPVNDPALGHSPGRPGVQPPGASRICVSPTIRCGVSSGMPSAAVARAPSRVRRSTPSNPVPHGRANSISSASAGIGSQEYSSAPDSPLERSMTTRTRHTGSASTISSGARPGRTTLSTPPCAAVRSTCASKASSPRQ